MTEIRSTTLSFKTSGYNDVQDITPAVSEWVATTGVRNGLLSLFVHGSTAALTTIEFESGVVADLKAAIERMAPMTSRTITTAAGVMATGTHMYALPSLALH